jgi:hypothetical protein
MILIFCFLVGLALGVGYIIGRKETLLKYKHMASLWKAYSKIKRIQVRQYFSVLEYFNFDKVQKFPWVQHVSTRYIDLNTEKLEQGKKTLRIIQKIQKDILKLDDAFVDKK